MRTSDAPVFSVYSAKGGRWGLCRSACARPDSLCRRLVRRSLDVDGSLDVGVSFQRRRVCG
jgi:hypothetical protein